ncbi:MAG: hypothetical protein ACYCTB_05650 [bacterium]
MNENCFLELLNACCCECGHKDKNNNEDKTCCNGIYIAKEHGYCQNFIKIEIKDDNNV